MFALVSIGDIGFFAAGAVAGYFFPTLVGAAVTWVRAKLKI